MLESGADPNCAPGILTLHFAAQSEDNEVVKLLVRYGAEVDLMVDGMTPLHYVVKQSCHLVLTTRYDPLVVIRTLLDNGADVSLSDKQGVTAIHLTSTHGVSFFSSQRCTRRQRRRQKGQQKPCINK